MSGQRPFLFRMSLFLALVVGIVVVLSGTLAEAFFANSVLNGVILGALVIGVVYNFRQVLLLKPDSSWLAAVKQAEVPGADGTGVRAQSAPASAAGVDAGGPAGPHDAVRGLAAQPARRHRLAARRIPRPLALHDRPADLPRPARHVLGPAPDRDLRRRRDRRPLGREPGHARRLRRPQGRPRGPARRHGHRLQLVALRPGRLARPRLSRPAGEPGAEPLLQRARGLALSPTPGSAAARSGWTATSRFRLTSAHSWRRPPTAWRTCSERSPAARSSGRRRRPTCSRSPSGWRRSRTTCAPSRT